MPLKQILTNYFPVELVAVILDYHGYTPNFGHCVNAGIIASDPNISLICPRKVVICANSSRLLIHGYLRRINLMEIISNNTMNDVCTVDCKAITCNTLDSFVLINRHYILLFDIHGCWYCFNITTSVAYLTQKSTVMSNQAICTYSNGYLWQVEESATIKQFCWDKTMHMLVCQQVYTHERLYRHGGIVHFLAPNKIIVICKSTFSIHVYDTQTKTETLYQDLAAIHRGDAIITQIYLLGNIMVILYKQDCLWYIFNINFITLMTSMQKVSDLFERKEASNIAPALLREYDKLQPAFLQLARQNHYRGGRNHAERGAVTLSRHDKYLIILNSITGKYGLFDWNTDIWTLKNSYLIDENIVGIAPMNVDLSGHRLLVIQQDLDTQCNIKLYD